MNEVTPEGLNPFLAEHFGPGETRLTRIGGGQSNPTFIVDHGDCRIGGNGEIDAEKIEFGCFSAERFIAGFTSLWGMFIVRLTPEVWPSG